MWRHCLNDSKAETPTELKMIDNIFNSLQFIRYTQHCKAFCHKSIKTQKIGKKILPLFNQY